MTKWAKVGANDLSKQLGIVAVVPKPQLSVTGQSVLRLPSAVYRSAMKATAVLIFIAFPLPLAAQDQPPAVCPES